MNLSLELSLLQLTLETSKGTKNPWYSLYPSVTSAPLNWIRFSHDPYACHYVQHVTYIFQANGELKSILVASFLCLIGFGPIYCLALKFTVIHNYHD